jgi:alpha-glucosidase
MLGEALLVYPIFSDEADDISVYIPKGDWYNYPTGKQIRNKNEDGGKIDLSGEFSNINIFMKGGSILPYQDSLSKFIPNTHNLHEEKTELIIIPDTEKHYAEGDPESI